DHRAVTTQERFKGRFVVLGDERLQQLSVGPFRPILRQRGPTQMLDDRAHWMDGHSSPSLASPTGPLHFFARPELTLYTFFFRHGRPRHAGGFTLSVGYKSRAAL